MVGGKMGVEGRRIEGVLVISAKRRRCLAVARRTGRGEGRWEEEVKIGERKEGVGVGRPAAMIACVSWPIVAILVLAREVVIKL